MFLLVSSFLNVSVSKNQFVSVLGMNVSIKFVPILGNGVSTPGLVGTACLLKYFAEYNSMQPFWLAEPDNFWYH